MNNILLTYPSGFDYCQYLFMSGFYFHQLFHTVSIWSNTVLPCNQYVMSNRIWCSLQILYVPLFLYFSKVIVPSSFTNLVNFDSCNVFVKISTNCCSVETKWSSIVPSMSCSLMKWYLILTCFVRKFRTGFFLSWQ